MNELIDDWNRLINGTISIDEFVRNHWEDFLGTYIKTVRKRDDADLYLKLHNYVDKMLKLDVTPVFEHKAQIIQYFKHCLINDKTNEFRKCLKSNTISLDFLNEEYNFELEGDYNTFIGDNDMNDLLCVLEKRLSPLQMMPIILALRGYSRKEISELLGTNLHTINDRLHRSKEIIYDIIKNQY